MKSPQILPCLKITPILHLPKRKKMSSSQSSPAVASSKSERGKSVESAVSSSKSERGKKKQKQKQKQRKKKMLSASHSTPHSDTVESILEVCDSDVESDETLWDLYGRWMAHYKVSRSLEEKKERFPTFKKHAKHIHLENKKDSITCKLELNPDSDMTMEEFDRKYLEDCKVSFQHLEINDRDVESDESLWDLYERWMAHYEVSRTLDEKNRRFAAFKEQVQYVHSQNKRDNMAYKLELNSFTDMTREEFESKRMGGFAPEDILKLWCMIYEMGGLCTEEDYAQGKMDGPRVKISGFTMVPPNDEEALQVALLKGPVVVCVDSRGDAFKNYTGGVLTEEVGKEPFLSVTLIGYGITPDGVKFWTIQNSWGTKWGEGGCMRIKRGVNLGGIASFASFPNLV